MQRSVSWFAIVTLVGLVGASWLTAAEHPEATLKSPVSSVAAGAALPLSGEEFLAGDPVKLVLRGVFDEYPLQEIIPEDGGVFSVELPIPIEVGDGEYRLVAIASDGDVVASLDLTILPAATAQDHEQALDDAEGAPHEEMGETARADERPIERTRAGMEWGLIGLLIGLAGGAGVSMMRR